MKKSFIRRSTVDLKHNEYAPEDNAWIEFETNPVMVYIKERRNNSLEMLMKDVVGLYDGSV
jgi:hypothetical protein